jgi:hypothetical protein
VWEAKYLYIISVILFSRIISIYRVCSLALLDFGIYSMILHFQTWLLYTQHNYEKLGKERLIPNLPPYCVTVDHSSYYNVLLEQGYTNLRSADHQSSAKNSKLSAYIFMVKIFYLCTYKHVSFTAKSLYYFHFKSYGFVTIDETSFSLRSKFLTYFV